MGRYHSGTYKLKKPEKYMGDPTKVVYRSSWERAIFLFCERNVKIKEWDAEEVIIPYYDKATKRRRRYFVDVRIHWSNGSKTLIEVKPHKETRPPRKKKNRQRYLQEAKTYVTNSCKWKAAENWSKENGYDFQIWTEKTLKKMGILKW